MREEMARAPVGDDVYHEDPTVLELERRVAEILGKEDAVYVPSGTMSNQIALRTHTEPGDMAVMDASAHMVINEGGGAAALSGVTVARLAGRAGIFSPEDVEDVLEVPHPFNPPNHSPRPRVVCVENTHNSGGGTIWPLETLTAVAATARRHAMALHMDGARLWHAAAASGVAERGFAEPFDTVSVCFSKGLGAPVGSALAGSRNLVTRARRFKQMYGGGFRQAGILAAGALFALDNHRDRLKVDVANARVFAEALDGLDGIEVDLDTVQSNIVRFDVAVMSAGDFADRCHEHGVHMLPGGHHSLRAVMHLGIEREDVDVAVAVVREVLAGA